MKKKIFALLLAAVMVMSLAACGGNDSGSGGGSGSGDTQTSTPSGGDSGSAAEPSGSGAAATAGVCWYNFADTFISSARQTLEGIAAADGTISVSCADSQGAVETQTSNMNNFFTQDVKYLVLNNINTNAISEICNQGEEAGVTMIFANTDSPADEDFAAHENLYFVSSRAEQSGQIMGEALLKYWQEHPEADRNGNGQLDYIMLLGMQGNYDTIMRSSKSLEVLENAGIALNCLGGDQVCEWSRATAQEKVAALLANYSDDLDAVISCNDDMALGAIEALKAGGFFNGGTYIPVCGVDATAVGVEAIQEGTLLVTSLNNPVSLAKGIYKVMYLLENGQEVNTANVGLEGLEVEGHRVWINYTAITADNVADATYDITDTDF